MLTRIKQWLCSHRYDLADLSQRDAQGNVHCRCHKCGKVNTAECGLSLPGRFDRYSAIPQFAGDPATRGVSVVDDQTKHTAQGGAQ